ncbi:ABC transporter permease [Nocardioides yefusunii]|uniref:FtsX-like permease family protein n=1 Tax=Nocardioides yefusunii TaxID=2500546 RepID=A0ABW1QYA3_9ACTN|nr:ABC transporter permease [Nocardioides yefusunii]
MRGGRRAVLRIAARDARRHPWRSLLVLLLIGLPVAVASGVMVLVSTFEISGAERAARVLAGADAQVWGGGAGNGNSYGDDLPGRSVWEVRDAAYAYDDLDDAMSPDAVAAAVTSRWGDDARLVRWDDGSTVDVRDGDGSREARLLQGDLSDPLVAAQYRLVEGTVPAASGEALVSVGLRARGIDVGDRVQTSLTDAPVTVVGVADDVAAVAVADRALLVAPGTVDLPAVASSWLVERPGGVSEEEVTDLAEVGVTVLSGVVAEASQNHGFGVSADDIAVLILVVTMILIEIALLAGPAFAVTARQQARAVALLTVNGATPVQARRVVTFAAGVLGAMASIGGVVLGVGSAWALVPRIERWSDSLAGPFGVPWLLVLVAALFGVVCAMLAAAVPAWNVSRQDPVAVMAGRRTARAGSLVTSVSAVAGAVALVLGVLITAASTAPAASVGSSAAGITVGVVTVVTGMVLVIPALLGLLARSLEGRSFSLRFAAGDAVRHRSRTVPAVAAVAATVAGVVALGIANASDASEYSSGSYGTLGRDEGRATVHWAPQLWDADQAARLEGTWGQIEQEARDLGATSVTSLVTLSREDLGHFGYYGSEPLPDVLGWAYGAATSRVTVVGDDVDLATLRVAEEDRPDVARALAAGHAVQFVVDYRPEPLETPGMDVGEFPRSERLSLGVPGAGASAEKETLEVDALLVLIRPELEGEMFSPALLPERTARELGLEFQRSALVAEGLPSAEDVHAFSDAVVALAPTASVDSALGYDYGRSGEAAIVMLVIAVGGALLMVIGAVTATALALQDAAPDLATLQAVGAGPRLRRRVAIAHTLVITGVGAVLGVLVGFVPGVAGARAMAGLSNLTIPWLELGLVVVVVPLVTALVVGGFSRSRIDLTRPVE